MILKSTPKPSWLRRRENSISVLITRNRKRLLLCLILTSLILLVTWYYYCFLWPYYNSYIIGTRSSLPFILESLHNVTMQPELSFTIPFSHSQFPMDNELVLKEEIPIHFRVEMNQTNSDAHLKKIIAYTEVAGRYDYFFGLGQGPFLFAHCPVNKCTITSDRERYPVEQWDALLYNFRGVGRRQLPTIRAPHTRYIFWIMETPIHLYENLADYNNVFNWTFSYRRDSDFYYPYGQVYRRKKRDLSFDRDFVRNKTKMVAWVVTHCGASSGRDSLASSLGLHVQVDVYGNCGPNACSRTNAQPHWDNWDECFAPLADKYKFYLSFENSLCRDYITEKFYSILQYDMLPIVYGAGDYKRNSPPHSYINVLDFPNAEKLAEYLQYLNENDTAYNEYFQWKKDYFVQPLMYRITEPWCRLCEKLHGDSTPKIVHELQDFFYTKSHCIAPVDSTLRQFKVV